ncbi:hypothetical protein Mp_4g05030 [Marchantia polymorpha subsp. ruderalis]|uniref:Uncharacterized protein n=2 Tax=Marchantia polymorpha TaxID=3197 RepID=A0AAF6B6I1_MARPO|nr:hypothetical protein MARPO_0087s0085 [Marchantia polymorpha]BBN07615.1 hypothetical protein Mp_4g05030 [Marchantia polymorpha subsp. ruderalis]|eukprot:PTQ33657.1 hypothetical protein MARPO_0087s0085 [Marchantia polymorpha]
MNKLDTELQSSMVRKKTKPNYLVYIHGFLRDVLFRGLLAFPTFVSIRGEHPSSAAETVQLIEMLRCVREMGSMLAQLASCPRARRVFTSVAVF